MIWDIYNALIADELINEKAGNNIKFYEYPEAKDVKETHLIIDPLDPPKPGDFADDKWLTDDYLFQIDVWSKDMNERDLIANIIRQIMWQLNFRQVGGIDEYDSDYDIFRDARRYRGKKYVKNL
ncbi:hypothetical protein [Gracilibacillus dipsosauri]|uniref:hypothetical protein n=1 Tax=Gracilibacillus dipsosauri TaxID=178340 RepID=UPI00240998FB